MHITCEQCKAEIPVSDLSVLQGDGVSCPSCHTLHLITATPRRVGMSFGSGNDQRGAVINFNGDVAGGHIIGGKKR